MFAYSFLAMTAYNILKPITRSKFITALGADNLPYVQLAAGVLIGVLMQVYSRAIGRCCRAAGSFRRRRPARSRCSSLFWVLFQTGAAWVSVAFYVLGLILGILLISQFWTLANDIYDRAPGQAAVRVHRRRRQPRRRDGRRRSRRCVVEEVGTNNLLLVSAAILAVCAAIVVAIVQRQQHDGAPAPSRSRSAASAAAKRSACCAVTPPAAHRARHRLCGASAPPSSISSSTWRPRR